MAWWLWVVVGIGLMVAEVITPGTFIALFFGISAILVGALVLIDIGGPDWLQWVLFPFIALGLIAVARKFLRDKVTGSPRKVDTIVGETATATEDIPVNAVGKVELRGSSWNAQNLSDLTLRK